MSPSQEYLPIKDIKNDLLIMKDGTVALVLQTSAVNFGLLSENEQLAIISSFAALLNSLSFAIQIVIRSKRLDISAYLKKLDDHQKKQSNPLLVAMIGRYKNFIETTIRENEVLDKQFYIVISLSYLEVGITKNIESNMTKILTTVLPRRDHIVRQLARIGLKAKQLNTLELIELFNDIYNVSTAESVASNNPAVNSSVLTPSVEPKPDVQPPAPQEQAKPLPNVVPNETIIPPPAVSAQKPPSQYSARNTQTPFVVEELNDEYISPS